TLGIVGFGRIGRRVAAKARVFGLRVLAADPYLPASVFTDHGVEPQSLDRLLAEADIVSLHVPLTAETRGLIGAAAFAAMRPGTVLINVARGPVVDEE